MDITKNKAGFRAAFVILYNFIAVKNLFQIKLHILSFESQIRCIRHRENLTSFSKSRVHYIAIAEPKINIFKCRHPDDICDHVRKIIFTMI